MESSRDTHFFNNNKRYINENILIKWLKNREMKYISGNGVFIKQY